MVKCQRLIDVKRYSNVILKPYMWLNLENHFFLIISETIMVYQALLTIESQSQIFLKIQTSLFIQV